MYAGLNSYPSSESFPVPCVPLWSLPVPRAKSQVLIPQRDVGLQQFLKGVKDSESLTAWQLWQEGNQKSNLCPRRSSLSRRKQIATCRRPCLSCSKAMARRTKWPHALPRIRSSLAHAKLPLYGFPVTSVILWVDKILHQSVGGLSQYLYGFIHPN